MMEYGLNIYQRGAQLGANFTLPSAGVKAQSAQTDLKTTDAAVIMDIKQPEIAIDYTECYRSMERYDPVDLTRHYAQKVKSEVLAFIGKKSLEGDRLARFETGFTVVDAAKMWKDQPEEYDVGLIPSVPPDIRFNLYEPRISVTSGDFAVNYSPGRVTVDPTGKVQVYTKDQGDIQITPTYRGHSLDLWA